MIVDGVLNDIYYVIKLLYKKKVDYVFYYLVVEI